MKYTVIRSCGHEQEIELFGKATDREKKIEWYRSTPCTACYKAEQNSNCEEIEMHYSEYKNNYADCDTKPGSYNRDTKTIVVYAQKEAEEKAKEVNNEKDVIRVANQMLDNTDKALKLVKTEQEKVIANNIIKTCKIISAGENLELFEDCKTDVEIAENIGKVAEKWALLSLI